MIKGIKIGNRESDFEIYGNGFKSTTKVFKNKKRYNRKEKHRSDYFCV